MYLYLYWSKLHKISENTNFMAQNYWSHIHIGWVYTVQDYYYHPSCLDQTILLTKGLTESLNVRL